jgi:hypothetical protein
MIILSESTRISGQTVQTLVKTPHAFEPPLELLPRSPIFT